MAGNASNGESFFRLLSVAPRSRELTGAVDLISHYQLREQYETFCKKPLPTSIADSKYFSNVVGDTELRRGEGMELGQLLQGEAGSSMPADHVSFQPFDIEVLRKAFTLKETGPISLPESERGLPTVVGKSKEEEDKKRKKHRHRSKDRDKEKDKDKKKDRDKDRKRDKDKDKDKDKDRNKGENGEKKHKKKKRRHEGEEGDDGHKHRSKKHKHSSKVEGQNVLIKNGK